MTNGMNQRERDMEDSRQTMSPDEVERERCVFCEEPLNEWGNCEKCAESS